MVCIETTLFAFDKWDFYIKIARIILGIKFLWIWSETKYSIGYLEFWSYLI